MSKTTPSTQRRLRRKQGIRKGLFGSAECPRMSVYRSSKHIYVQVINDFTGSTIASSSSVQLKLPYGGNVEAAKQVGQEVAKAVQAAGVNAVCFDRNGFKYHGRIKALADAAREAGLQF